MELPKILIMCGGRGKRLSKITRKIPKPLVKIGVKTILELKLENYKRQGFNEFVICIGYKGEIIKRAVNNFDFKINSEYSDIGEPAGILERLYSARNFFGKQVILTYGDTYAKINLNPLIKAHNIGRNGATIVVAPIKSPFGLIEFNGKDKVTSFNEKPVLNYYIGYAIINKSALDILPKKVIKMPDGEGIVEFYKMLLKKKRLGAYYYNGPQITFNTEDELKIAREKILSFYTAKEAN